MYYDLDGSTRENAMKTIHTVLVLLLMSASVVAAAPPHAAGPGASPDQVLEGLIAGNQHYASGHMKFPHQSPARRTEVAGTQHPVAVIVGCSDSRVSPEIVFDEGIGDLFVVRTAGNRLDDLVLASIEYAVDHLGCSLVVVMGHERCGAITAAIDAAKEPAENHANDSHVPVLLHLLQDAVTKAKNEPGDRVDNTVVENIRIVTRDLPKQSPMLAGKIKAGTLQVVGVRYDLDSGVVSIIESNTTPPAAKEQK